MKPINLISKGIYTLQGEEREGKQKENNEVFWKKTSTG